MLRNACPATTSYVHDFDLDEHAPTYLPTTFAHVLTRDDVENACAAYRRGLSWAEYATVEFERFIPPPGVPNKPTGVASDDGARLYLDRRHMRPEELDELEGYYAETLHLRDPTERIYTTPQLTHRIRIWARADFNNDGIEDLLVHGYLINKSLRTHPCCVGQQPGHLLTRESPNAVLRELRPQDWGCKIDP